MNALATRDDYPQIRDVKARPAELLPKISKIRQEALDYGMPLTEYLERLDPSEEYGASHGLNAFERQLMVAGIKVNSVPHRGLRADSFERFGEGSTIEERTVNAELANEWVSNVWRSVVHRPPSNNRVTFSSDDLPYRESSIEEKYGKI